MSFGEVGCGIEKLEGSEEGWNLYIVWRASECM